MRSLRRFGCSAVVGLVGVLAASCESFDPASSSSPDGGSGGGTNPTAPPAEDCFDGRDDNDDGKRDCEEPTCSPYARCVPGPGALGEWAGYFTLVEGDCPPEIPDGVDVWAASSDVATCSSCKCTPSAGCGGSVSIAESIVSNCGTTLPFALTVGVCGTIPPAAGGPATYWQVPEFGTKKCTASSDPPVLPKRSRPARLCSNARLGAGCSSGQVCASRGESGRSTGTCVSRAHNGGPPLPCPEAFPVAHLVVPGNADADTSFTDKRGCSECTCGPAMGASCNAVLSLYSDDNCTTLVNSVKGSACTNVSCGGKNGCGSGRIDVTPVPGTCAPAGGAPTGTIDLAGPGQQLCCER